MLTERQHEVLKALVAGQGLAEIAEALGIKQTTLRAHLEDIRRFYDTDGYREAIEEARRRGDL